MKILISIQLIASLAVAIKTAPPTNSVKMLNLNEIDNHWTLFRGKHSKAYKNSDEENKRKTVFKNTLKKINLQNLKYNNGEITYTSAINQFSDWVKNLSFKLKYYSLISILP